MRRGWASQAGPAAARRAPRRMEDVRRGARRRARVRGPRRLPSASTPPDAQAWSGCGRRSGSPSGLTAARRRDRQPEPRVAHQRRQDDAGAHAPAARHRRGRGPAARDRDRRGPRADRHAGRRHAPAVGYARIRRQRAAVQAPARERQPDRLAADAGVGPLHRPALLLQPAGDPQRDATRATSCSTWSTPPRSRRPPATSRRSCEILGWIGKPVLRAAEPDGPRARRGCRRGRRGGAGAGTSPPYPWRTRRVALDAFARCWVQEDRLLGAVGGVLSAAKRSRSSGCAARGGAQWRGVRRRDARARRAARRGCDGSRGLERAAGFGAQCAPLARVLVRARARSRIRRRSARWARSPPARPRGARERPID